MAKYTRPNTIEIWPQDSEGRFNIVKISQMPDSGMGSMSSRKKGLVEISDGNTCKGYLSLIELRDALNEIIDHGVMKQTIEQWEEDEKMYAEAYYQDAELSDILHQEELDAIRQDEDQQSFGKGW